MSLLKGLGFMATAIVTVAIVEPLFLGFPSDDEEKNDE